MEISLKKVLSILVKNLFFILIFAILCSVVAFLFSAYVVSPVYKSSVKFNVYTDSSTSTDGENINDYNLAVKNVAGCIEYLNENDFYSQIAEASGLGYTTGDIKNMLSYNVVLDTEFFKVIVSAPSPSDAKTIADTVADIAPKRVQEFKGREFIRVVQTANLPTQQSSPNIILNSIVSFILGALLSFFIFLIRDLFDDRIKDASELTERYSYPILGSVPDFSNISGVNKREIK